MRCLILAAGQGSRLRVSSACKPLTPVGGVPLLEHVVRAAVQAGATGFVVVTGYRAEEVEAAAIDLAGRVARPIDCVRTEDFTRPNGHSLLTAADAIRGDYLLLMADHLFDPTIARRLIESGRGDAALLLAIDRNVGSETLDLEDATKVETGPGDRIERIGKSLSRYDAIDTGLFLAGPALAGAVRAAIDAGAPGSLSDGVQRLATQGLAAVLDVTGARWIDVDDPRMLALAEQIVRT